MDDIFPKAGLSKKVDDPQILVVKFDAELADSLLRFPGTSVKIIETGNEMDALESIRTTRPDIVIITGNKSLTGYAGFYHEIRRGWISRHCSVLLVLRIDTSTVQLLDDEYLDKELAARPKEPSPPIPINQFSITLQNLIEEKLEARQNQLKKSLEDKNAFCVIWEQIPGLGSFEKRQETILNNTRKASQGGKICAISVTDNPGGNPGIANEVLSGEIRRLGIDPLVHIAFRDRSRNQCESLLYQLAAMDISNLLVLTGDYPSNRAYEGTSRPVFDLDSVTGLRLIREMNRGMEHEIMAKKTTLAPTDFFPGVAFSPFKEDKAEVIGQYLKLRKKIEAGARFIITQIGYDARKLHELQAWLKAEGLTVPTIASIYVLSPVTAQAMNNNGIPGCVVTDKLLREIRDDFTDNSQGRQRQILRAAKLYAIVKGLGFSGVSISGQGISYPTIEAIITQGQDLFTSWPSLVGEFSFPQTDGFYLFNASPKTGLNEGLPVITGSRARFSLNHIFSKIVHKTIFEPRSPFFGLAKKLAYHIDRSRFWKKIFNAGETSVKMALYGCQHCGDCALFDVAYLCPVSQCPKNQRNGPCGGSYQGWCEVYPKERKCIWVKAYHRMGNRRFQANNHTTVVPPCDWSLWETSSWLNYFNGRDHLGKKLGTNPLTTNRQDGRANG